MRAAKAPAPLDRPTWSDEFDGTSLDLSRWGYRADWRGWLHTVTLSGLYRHRSGIFARAEGVFFAQDREREGSSLAGDDFWQVNLIAGYRFPKQRAEVAIGAGYAPCGKRPMRSNRIDSPCSRALLASMVSSSVTWLETASP